MRESLAPDTIIQSPMLFVRVTIVVLRRHVQRPDFSFMLIESIARHLANVPDLHESIDSSSNNLIVIEPLQTQYGFTFSHRGEALTIRQIPQFNGSISST